MFEEKNPFALEEKIRELKSLSPAKEARANKDIMAKIDKSNFDTEWNMFGRATKEAGKYLFWRALAYSALGKKTVQAEMALSDWTEFKTLVDNENDPQAGVQLAWDNGYQLRMSPFDTVDYPYA